MADGVKSEGDGFLSGFGQGLNGLVGGLGNVLGSVFNGLGGLFGAAAGSAGGAVASAAIFGSLLGGSQQLARLRPGRRFRGQRPGSTPSLPVVPVRSGAVIDTPTLFPLAAGGVAIVREALRNEAILPTMRDGRAVQGRTADGQVMPLSLTRLPNGDLGVVLPEPPVPYARGGVPGLDIPAAPLLRILLAEPAWSTAGSGGGSSPGGSTYYIDARGSDIGVETRLQRVMQRTVPQTIKGSDRYAQDQDERISARRRGRRG